MPDQANPIPPDDLSRRLTIARPDEDQGLPHIGLVGDTYTILVAGQDTAGKYTLIGVHDSFVGDDLAGVCCLRV
jgi:hypothetical protein